MNISTKTVRIAVTSVLATAGLFTAAGPASAGSCSGDWCGGLIVDSSSQRAVAYTLQWTTSGTPVVSGYVEAGQRAGGVGTGVDVDGFRVNTGCVALNTNSGGSYDAGWHKINDYSTFNIYVVC